MTTGLARERVEERSFSTAGAAELNLKSYSGNLTIESSADEMVRVKVVATSLLPNDQAAGRALQALEFNARQEGDRVMLEVTNPPGNRGAFFLGRQREPPAGDHSHGAACLPPQPRDAPRGNPDWRDQGRREGASRAGRRSLPLCRWVDFSARGRWRHSGFPLHGRRGSSHRPRRHPHGSHRGPGHAGRHQRRHRHHVGGARAQGFRRWRRPDRGDPAPVLRRQFIVGVRRQHHLEN